MEVRGLTSAACTTLAREGLSPGQWQKALSVFANISANIAPADMPAMQGNYVLENGRIRFTPSYPLQPGIRYLAVFRPDFLPTGTAAEKVQSAGLRVPQAPQVRRTVVNQVFPSAEVLPENLLKFYLHFSAPMSRGRIYDHIQLREAGGAVIELPFLEIDEELWDPGMTRLTLFIDPGRIKRGVQPLEDIGPALEEGKTYELRIDARWQDASGVPLRSGFTKRFRIGPADRKPIHPQAWTLHPPRRGTSSVLRVGFDEPLDHALGLHCLEVIDLHGAPVEGVITLEAGERRWEFKPRRPWQHQEYALKIRTTLEDLAGNNIGKPFDVDTFVEVDALLAPASMLLPFRLAGRRP